MRLPLKLAYSLFIPKGKLANDFRNYPPTLIFHCLLGCRKTWSRIAQEIANQTQRQVYTLDSCNHGESPSSYNTTLVDMACDVESFLESKNIRKCELLGHSMGGRIAMILALQKPSMVQTLTLVDISPVQQPSQMVTMMKSWADSMKKAIESLPETISFEDAKAAVHKKLMEDFNFDSSFCSMVLDTLVKKGDSFCWLSNLDILVETFENQILRFPDMSPLSYSGPTFFIGSEKPIYMKLKDHMGIYKLFPKAEITYMSGTTHLVPFDKPEAFLKEVMTFRKRYTYLLDL